MDKPKTTATNGLERDGAFIRQNSLSNGGNRQRVILFSSRDRANSTAKTLRQRRGKNIIQQQHTLHNVTIKTIKR